MIELKAVHKSFGSKKVLQNFNLKIPAGCTQMLVGLSGSGKTTTLKLINGLLKAESGRITVLKKDLQEHKLIELRRQIGYVIQQAGLFPHYSVEENISVVPRLLGWSIEKRKRRCTEILQKLHLKPEEYAPKFPHELSGGEQQRVGLARALAANPPVLLMDEPFGALDPITRNRIKDEFKQMDELRKKTIVMVSHDIRLAFELGDKVALMHDGNILQNDSPEEILRNPAGEAVEAFLSNDWLSLRLITEKRLQAANKRLQDNPQQADWNKIIGGS